MSEVPPAGAGLSRPGAGFLQTIRFPVAGMTCGACVVHITKAVKPLDGVDRVKVNLRDELVTVRRDPDRVSDEAITEAILEAGYEPDLASADVIVEAESRGLFERWFHR